MKTTRAAEDRLQERIIQRVMPGLVRELTASASDFSEAARADALLLLYQLLAILHAEARGLLPMADPAYEAISLQQFARETSRRVRAIPLRTRLERLFGILRSGDRRLRVMPYPGKLFATQPCRRLSEKMLTETLVALTRDEYGTLDSEQLLDYAALDIRHLGSLYEALLKGGFAPSSPLQDHPQHAIRKLRGAYFTPPPIVDHIVGHALGPVLDQHLKALRPLFRTAAVDDASLINRFFNLRILDPAVGAGYFLLAAADYLAERMADFLRPFPNNPVSRALQKSGTRPRGDTLYQLLQQQVLAWCIHGVDIDPVVIEVARLGLYLQGAIPGRPAPVVRLQHGNTLQAGTVTAIPGFDVVLGNPPYGATLGADTLAAAREELPLMQSNPDTAVGFLERALQLLRPGGRVGLILPKPLLYSYAWRKVRSALRGRIYHLADVSRAWRDVRLEQIILVAGSEPTGAAAYTVTTLSGNDFTPAEGMPWTWADRFQTLPCALDAEERELLNSLLLSPTTLGQLCKTFRGLPVQRQLSERGPVAVIGGRDLARWQIRSSSGYLISSEPSQFARFRVPKLLFQNIVAHIRQPRPHIQLIGAYDCAGTVTLDTVNNLVARQPGVDLWGILALLHSDLINWFVYAVVYSKAIRTMHFDQYFLDKVPLPPDWGKLLARLAPLARTATRLADKGSQRTTVKLEETLERMNRLVNEVYGVSKPAFPPI